MAERRVAASIERLALVDWLNVSRDIAPQLIGIDSPGVLLRCAVARGSRVGFCDQGLNNGVC